MSLFLGNSADNQTGEGLLTDFITHDMIRRDYPFTISGWGKTPNAVRTNDVIICTAGGSSTTNCVRLGMTAGKAFLRVNGGGNAALSDAVVANNAWTNYIGVGASATDRKAYLNGGNVGSNVISATCTSGDNATIGAARGAGLTTDSGWLGWLAEIAVWNEALTESEIDALGHGENPMHIRIWALIYYHPLHRTIVPRFPGSVPGNLRRWGNPAFSFDHPPVIPTEIANRRFFMPMDQVLRVHRGTAALVSGPAVLTAAGKRVSQGVVTLQSGPAVLNAAGQRVVHGAAALHSGAASLAAAGQRASQGVAALQSGAAHLVASGQRGIQGTGVLVSGPAALRGEGGPIHTVLESPFGIPALWFIRTIEPFDTEDAVWLDADGRLRVSQNYVTDCHSETVTTSRPITAADADALLLIDGTVTLTLPNLPLPGTRLFVMVKTGGSSCSFVAGSGASIITKGTATSLASVGAYAEAVYTGSGVWALLSNDLT